jgi:methylmalonyl-CoA/ethylmalonyl-CoA epimerase
MTSSPFTGINHLCVVTSDMERSVRAWSDRYGVGPWEIWTKDASNMSALVEGNPAQYVMRAAMCPVSASFRLELIQPLDGHGPYARSLAQHHGRDHVHHIRFDVADYDAARQGLERLGAHVLADEEFSGAPGVPERFRATYFATEEDLGFVLQIGQAPTDFQMPPPDERYPAAEGEALR